MGVTIRGVANWFYFLPNNPHQVWPSLRLFDGHRLKENNPSVMLVRWTGVNFVSAKKRKYPFVGSWI
jgi:hypothetical protein